MLHQLARTFWAFKQAYANELNLSTIEVSILGVLSDRDGLTQQELTTYLRCDPSMVTRTVKEMEHELGWIERARDPDDRRLMRVFLTDTGRARAIELPNRARAIEERMLRDLSEDDRAYLRQILRTLEATARRDSSRPPGDPQV